MEDAEDRPGRHTPQDPGQDLHGVPPNDAGRILPGEREGLPEDCRRCPLLWAHEGSKPQDRVGVFNIDWVQVDADPKGDRRGGRREWGSVRAEELAGEPNQRRRFSVEPAIAVIVRIAVP